jgi:hypothetical protein
MLAGYWLDHPFHDPYLGPCPADHALANRLVYNGEIVANGNTIP